MAKGCLDKLTGSMLTTCNVAPVGVSDLYLIYPEDVTLTFISENQQISAIAFATGARSYRMEGYKQNIQVTAALRTLDASVRYDVSVKFKFPESSPFLGGRLRGGRLMNGKFYVLEIPYGSMDSDFNIWGVNVPLECTNIEYDSNANGKLITVTLSAPEGSAGNNRITCSAAVKDSIIAKSV